MVHKSSTRLTLNKGDTYLAIYLDRKSDDFVLDFGKICQRDTIFLLERALFAVRGGCGDPSDVLTKLEADRVENDRLGKE